MFERLARWYPVGRVGRPTDIAAAIAFLAADEAGFVNGANLTVHGGGEQLAFSEHQRG